MINLALNLLLWGVVVALALAVGVRSRIFLTDSLRTGLIDFLNLLPRITLGVIGSGFLAEVLPPHLVAAWLGPGSGFTGLLLATIAGAITPGGPIVGFAIGATALKGGAGAPQVIAYTTAWALFALQRLVLYEIASMPARVVWVRAAVSLPLPFLAALVAILSGKP